MATEPTTPAPLGSEPSGSPQQISAAIQEISERAQSIVRDEIELAKVEVTEKVTKIAKGAAIGAAAGVFAIGGLILLLHGFAWLAWWALPVGNTAFFWGFFLIALILFVLGAIAGLVAAKLFKAGSPPKPDMAIEANRVELGRAISSLKGEVTVATDWRRQVEEHKQQVLIAAAVAGFVIGGGIAALAGLGRRKKRR